MSDKLPPIGDRLLQLRKLFEAPNWKIFSLACNLSHSHMNRIARLERFDGETIRRIVEATGVSLDWLILGRGSLVLEHLFVDPMRARVRELQAQDIASRLKGRGLNPPVKMMRKPRPKPGRGHAGT